MNDQVEETLGYAHTILVRVLRGEHEDMDVARAIKYIENAFKADEVAPPPTRYWMSTWQHRPGDYTVRFGGTHPAEVYVNEERMKNSILVSYIEISEKMYLDFGVAQNEPAE